MKIRLYSLVVIFCFISGELIAQIDSIRFKLIELLSKDLNKYYVSGGLAKQMEDSIRFKFKNGDYDNSLNDDEFTFEISKDLRRISMDNHISISSPRNDHNSLDQLTKGKKHTTKVIRKNGKKNENTVERLNSQLRSRTKNDMFTYGDIKIMQGNVGYVEIFDFNSTSYFKHQNKKRLSIESVFSFFKNTHSIIIDLRENQGGSTRQAAKFCSYFSKTSSNYFISTENFLRYDSSGLEKEYSLKRTLYTEEDISNSLTQSKKIYILTSKRTFSSAELVAYKIKQFIPEAVIIGEQTKGGGNGYTMIHLTDYYTAIIPSERSFDESNDNFSIEGKGIRPDIFSDADSALEVALTLTSVVNYSSSTKKVKYLRRKEVPSSKVNIEVNYSDYKGNYRKIVVCFRNNKFYLVYDGFKKVVMVSLEKDLFQGDGHETIRFIRNESNIISEVQITFIDGYIEKFKKM